MKTIRTELCELVCQILPQATTSRAADAVAATELAPVLGEAIAEAILAKYSVVQRDDRSYFSVPGTLATFEYGANKQVRRAIYRVGGRPGETTMSYGYDEAE